MYSRTYDNGKIEVPGNYGGVVFGDDMPYDAEIDKNSLNNDNIANDRNDDKNITCNMSGKTEEKHSEQKCEDDCNHDVKCDKEPCEDGLFSTIKRLFDGFGIGSDSGDLLLLALAVILYGNGGRQSSELSLILLFLLLIK